MRRSTILLLILMAVLVFVAACSSARSDEAIATDIKAKMFSEPQLKDTNLQVSVSKGQVTLAGAVPSDTAHYAAFKLATETPGVTKVNDQMTVQVAQATPPPVPMPAPEPVPALKPVHRVRHTPPPAPVEPIPATPTPAPAEVRPPPPPPPPPPPRQVEIPAGTTISVRTIDTIDSAVNHVGEQFETSLDAPIVLENEVIVTKDAKVFMRLVQASSAGHVSGRSELRLELVRMEYQGKTYPLVSSTYDQAGSSRGKRTAETVGGGAVLGALIGAIAGGGKGAAIGAGVGAAGGGVVQGVTKGQQVRIPPETRLDFRLESPINLTLMPRKSRPIEQ